MGLLGVIHRRRWSGECQGDIGEIVGRIIVARGRVPVDHAKFDGLPLVLAKSPGVSGGFAYQKVGRHGRNAFEGEETSTHLSKMSLLVYL